MSDIWHKPNEGIKLVAGLAILVLEDGDLNTMWMYPSQKCPEYIYGTDFVSPDDKPKVVVKWCWAAELISTLSTTRKALDVAVDALKLFDSGQYTPEADAYGLKTDASRVARKALEQINEIKGGKDE